MAYRTRTSPALEKALKRNLALQSIDPNLDMGHGLSVSEFSISIEDTQSKVNRYNLAIATLTQYHNEMVASEKALLNHHERMLNGVSGKFGRDSTEYEMAGGRKRLGTRKTKATKPVTTDIPIVTIPAASTVSSPTTTKSDPAQLVANAMMN
jgi:hypothetical protein